MVMKISCPDPIAKALLCNSGYALGSCTKSCNAFRKKYETAPVNCKKNAAVELMDFSMKGCVIDLVDVALPLDL